MKIQLEEANPKDATGLAVLLSQLGYPTQESQAIDKIKTHQETGYKLLVAKDDVEILGFIALHIYHAIHLSGMVGRITAFCVDETVRNTGVGNMLLLAAEEFFNHQDCMKIEVTSNLRRTQTHAYYLKRGYQESNRHFVKLLSKTNS